MKSRDSKDTIGGKIPPQNLEAELSVLGAILLDKDALIKIIDRLEPEDFYDPRHGLVYEAMVDVYQQRQPVDILSVSARLQDKKQLDTIGGSAFLATLTESVPTASHIVTYADIVISKATLRRLIAAADHITALGYQEESELTTILDQAEQKLFSISQKHLQQNFIPIKNVLSEAFDRIDDIHKEGGSRHGLTTGFRDLDELLAGLHPSDLIILAARPSVGKTSLALDIARAVAIREKTPVGIFSLEMSKEQLVDRMLSASAGISLWKMHTGKLQSNPLDDDFTRLGEAMGMLADAPIYIDDSPSAGIMELRAKARRLQMEHGLGLIIVDYLQLMEGRTFSGVDNRVQEVAEITRGLKQVARELKVPVLALSQLSRMVEQRSPAIPRLSDLRESGSIEQDADVVMFIYRKAVDKSQQITEEEKHLAEIHVAKHRNGPVGVVNLFFNGDRVSFSDLDQKYHHPFGTT